jgi:polysaccharide biosynthesis/export protein
MIMVRKTLGRFIGLCACLWVAALFQGCATAGADPSGAFADVPGMAVADANGSTAPGAPTEAHTPGTPTPAAQTAATQTPAAQPGSQNSATNSESEIVRRGESLNITFSDLPTPVAPFADRVKEDGTITLIYNQVFTAVGKSRGQLEREIRERYVPRFFVRLTVTIQPNERSYTIGGEVKAPNRYAWFPGMTLLKAIQSAGDFTDFAQKKRVQVVRNDGRKETVNCVKAIGDSRYDVPIYSGDTIHVPRRLL